LLPFFRLIAWSYLKLTGWQVVGEKPAFKNYVLIVAPHTSNWDFPAGVSTAFMLGLNPFWMGKDALFRFPHGFIFSLLGGVAIDRSRSHNMVASSIRQLKDSEEFCLVITPEGTRSLTEGWKTGFYHIAHGAGVPLVLGFIDGATKRIGLGTTIVLTGDMDADFAQCAAFFKPIKGIRNENFGPVRAREKKD
jgi:1-acyl-sn-glycerol-3-phosphate acyltransferase